MSDYAAFLESKAQRGARHGFSPLWMPAFLFDFQAHLVEWALHTGRAAIFADCGLGKTPMQLVWAENVVRHTNRHVLILTPLAVAAQAVREGEKFGIGCHRVIPTRPGIVVANYERLHHFSPDDFAGVVCDESSILKDFDGVRRGQITAFMRQVPYRLLCTATAAPNDYTELGTSSEALGHLGHIDMLNRFFKNDLNNSATGRYCGKAMQWRFKGHAEVPFWRWVASWARAVRKPSDLGFDDGPFILPPLEHHEHVVDARVTAPGMLPLGLPAQGLKEQREERRLTVRARVERVAALLDTAHPAIAWCDLNEEGDRLTAAIRGAVQVAGGDCDEAKEEKFLAFIDGEARVLVTKPKIGAWGLNFQHCAHQSFFPSHSFEQYYQAVRRCWRFGQTRPVRVELVTTAGAAGILTNLACKAAAADLMFARLVDYMGAQISIDPVIAASGKTQVPAWL